MTVTSRSALCRLALLAVASGCLSVSAIGGPGGGVSSIAEREIARRNARMEDARQALERGDIKYAEGDYEAALGEYKGALDSLPNAPMTREWRALAAAKYADCAVALARDRATNGRYKEARELLAEAIAINPEHKAAKLLLKQLDDPDRFPRALTPEHVQKVQDVKRGLEMANSHKDLGNYNEAEKEFEKVLQQDPFNTAARRGMEDNERKKTEYMETAYDHTRAKMLREVTEMWETKVAVAGFDTGTVLTTGTQPSAYLTEKMQKIIFPQVSFSGATIEEAIEFLRVKSKDLDPEPNPAKKGVNIILQMGDTPVNAQITLDVNDVPMSEALKFVTDLAGMKFKVEPFAVIVLPLSVQSDTQYTRIFRVPPDFESQGGGEAGGGGGGAAAPADPFAAGGGGGGGAGAALIKRKTAKEILTEAGIAFPEGSSAVFNKMASQLVVKNTQANLDLIEAYIESIINNKPKMIVITSKFVEVTQKNTNELGFDWLLGPFNIQSTTRTFASGGTQGNSANGNLDPINYPFRFPGTQTPAVGQNPVTGGLRFGSAAITPDSIDGLLGGVTTTSTLTPGIMAFSGVFTDPQFQVVIRALSQSKGVDLMSAPSVTTKSGSQATVEVIREFIYPTEFEPPEIPQQFGSTGGNVSLTGSGGGTSGGAFPVTPTTPTAFEMKKVGVVMQVEPVLGPDGNTIDLNLAPEVTEFEGFVNYGSPIQTSAVDALGNPTTIVLTENRIPQPVFSSRKVQTSVTVYDGATVVMGGLIREDVQDVEDKVPLLGDIPVIGRLFQTKAEDHFKRNMMVFVTARLIDPSGAYIKQQGPPPATPSGDPNMGGPNPILPPVGMP